MIEIAKGEFVVALVFALLLVLFFLVEAYQAGKRAGEYNAKYGGAGQSRRIQAICARQDKERDGSIVAFMEMGFSQREAIARTDAELARRRARLAADYDAAMREVS